MNIRRATIEDLNNIVNLFADTIREINSADYNKQEVEVWAEGSKDLETWAKKIESQTFFIAIQNSSLLGFSSIDKTGYVDYLFVHKDFQRQGIANSLMKKIEEIAEAQNNREIYAYVSITAKGFFKKIGFHQAGKKFTTMRGVEFVSDKMIKRL